MAGTNKKLKPGETLFKEGDPADAMYLVRKGELKVFKAKAGHEIVLAQIGDGGMIGEMAFFDKMPRSASVAATKESDVTVISNDDFSKLMKQIPKWFVALMSSLSSRLRNTNERLQAMEAKALAGSVPYDHTLKILYILDLLFHKDAVKEGKDWHLNQSKALKYIADILRLDETLVRDTLNIFTTNKALTLSQDQYKNNVYALANRGSIERIASFIATFVTESAGKKSLPDNVIELLNTIVQMSSEGAYEAVNLALDDIIKEGERNHLDISNWHTFAGYFKKPSDALTLIKVSDGKMGFKVGKKEVPRLIEMHKLLLALAKANAS